MPSSRDYRPSASPEVVSGYAYTAELAERRQEQVAARGDEEEARIWGQVAEYLRLMAQERALDDDQTPALRLLQRHRRERPMPAEVMDTLAIRRVDTTEEGRRHLDPWQEAVMELALGYLSPIQRVCFELIVGGKLSTREVAEAIGGTPSEIRSHMARARRTIEEKVRPRLEDLIRETERE